MDEQDAKHKDELLAVERAKLEQMDKKLDLQHKAMLAKIEQGDKKLELHRELQIESMKLKRDMVEVNRFQTEAQIMFTDLTTCHPTMRFWIAKKQREILIKEGINPDEVEATASASQHHQPPTNPQ